MTPCPHPSPWRFRRPSAHRLRGESLVAVLIGLALGLGVITGGIGLWMVMLKAQRKVLQESRMQQELHAALDWMAQELRQAQYLHEAWQTRTAADCSDAFCGAPEDFSASNSQIEVSWDRNDDGLKENKECSGFQLRSNELRTKTSCETGQWQVITHAEVVKVTALQFTPHCTWRNGSVWRHIDIQLSAELPSDPLTKVTHQLSVQLRNAQPAATAPSSCN